MPRAPVGDNVQRVIKFHYHASPRDVRRIGIVKGDPLCHVYSDSSVAELVAWGEDHGLKAEWIDRRNALPHFDVHGELLRECGRGVTRAELVRDIRRWRARSRDRRQHRDA